MIPERLRPKKCGECIHFDSRIDWCLDKSEHRNSYDDICKNGKN